MPIIIHGWMPFVIASGMLMLTALVMQWSGGYFLTRDVLVRNFTIMDLELAATETEINNLLNGILKLPAETAARVIRALRTHLFADFIFMPAAYGALFIACMKVAYKMPLPGDILFLSLGWMQLPAWIADVVENVYLLRKINRLGGIPLPPLVSFPAYQALEVTKWGLSMLAAVCVLSALLYYWVSGLYMPGSLKYLLVLVLQLAVFIFLMGLAKKSGKRWKQTAPH